jgi:alkaline phosphatase D
MEVKVVYPEGFNVNNIEGAVPGATGEVRVRYRKEGTESWSETAWKAADKEHDFTIQFLLDGLSSGSSYDVLVQCRPLGVDVVSDEMSGGFVTAPAPDNEAPVRFMVSTGQAYGDQDADGGGYKIYPAMLKLEPHFFVHTGDIVYYDGLAKNVGLAYWHWQRMYSLPTNIEFHRQVDSYFIKDDHDTWMNDCWPGRETRFMGDFTFEQGLEVFLHVVPMGDRTYRTRRWGKDLQIWMVEGRDFRSPNTMPDGPEKTIWGEEQKQWFKKTVEASDATFKILISPTPVVGPDRKNKKDNHSNSNFSHEGNEIREFISRQPNMYVVCGDRHWQYVSKDAKTGVLEFSCGPASDEHAGGWSQEDVHPEHLYLNVVGGFLEVAVERDGGRPEIAFRHYGVDGDLLNEYAIVAE